MDTLPSEALTAATVLSAPDDVMIVCEVDVAVPDGRIISVWAPLRAYTLLMAPAESEADAIAPSISTSTGPVNAFTTRTAGSLPLKPVGPFPHAARSGGRRTASARDEIRMAPLVPRKQKHLLQIYPERIAAQRRMLDDSPSFVSAAFSRPRA